MRPMEFNLVPRTEDGHLELHRTAYDWGWKEMYATLTFDGNLATSIISPTGLFKTTGEADKHLEYLHERVRKDVWREYVRVRENKIRIPRDGDLTLPQVEPARTVALHVLEAALKTLTKAPYTGGCRTFYTPEEWKEKENYELNNELLFICHDGGEFADLCSYDRGQYGMMEEFSNYLNEHGYWMEQGSTWWTVVYPADTEENDETVEDSDNEVVSSSGV